MNEIDSIAAAISVIGIPLSTSGISALSIFPLTPAKSTIAIRKPTPAPQNALQIDSRKP